jgi:hypothetical protein
MKKKSTYGSFGPFAEPFGRRVDPAAQVREERDGDRETAVWGVAVVGWQWAHSTREVSAVRMVPVAT